MIYRLTLKAVMFILFIPFFMSAQEHVPTPSWQQASVVSDQGKLLDALKVALESNEKMVEAFTRHVEASSRATESMAKAVAAKTHEGGNNYWWKFKVAGAVAMGCGVGWYVYKKMPASRGDCEGTGENINRENKLVLDEAEQELVVKLSRLEGESNQAGQDIESLGQVAGEVLLQASSVHASAIRLNNGLQDQDAIAEAQGRRISSVSEALGKLRVDQDQQQKNISQMTQALARVDDETEKILQQYIDENLRLKGRLEYLEVEGTAAKKKNDLLKKMVVTARIIAQQRDRMRPHGASRLQFRSPTQDLLAIKF